MNKMIISLLMMSFVSVSQAQIDVSQCHGLAAKAAISFAQQQTHYKINYRVGSVVDIKGRGPYTVSTYDLGLEQCGSTGCGDLGYTVVVRGLYPHCQILSIEMTSEE